MSRQKSHHAFTLIEIMIVVLIIGILLAIAVPNFQRARESVRQKACISNLKQIQSAKEQWAIENRKASTATPPTLAQIVGPDNYLQVLPRCPAGGRYRMGRTVIRNPGCNYPNALFPHRYAALNQ